MSVDLIAEARQSDGSLYLTIGGMIPTHIDWEPRDETVVLDGDFTADQLRAIADYMDAHRS